MGISHIGRCWDPELEQPWARAQVRLPSAASGTGSFPPREIRQRRGSLPLTCQTPRTVPDGGLGKGNQGFFSCRQVSLSPGAVLQDGPALSSLQPKPFTVLTSSCSWTEP